jgi:hypothetical protein
MTAVTSVIIGNVPSLYSIHPTGETYPLVKWVHCHYSMVQMVSIYGVLLQIHGISSHVEPTKGGPPAWGLGMR